MIIAASITIAVFSMVTHFIFNSYRSNARLETKSNIKNMLQMGINRIGRHISISKRLFDNTTVGNAYIQKIDYGTNTPVPINTSVLPIINSNGSLSPEKLNDPDTPFIPANIGNSIFFTELVENFKNFPDTLPYKRTLDVYQFLYYYLSKDTQGMQTKSRYFTINNNLYPYLDLIEWHSIRYVDYYQLNTYLNDIDAGYIDPQKTTYKTSITTTLSNNNYLIAWDRSQNLPNDAFYNINSNGTLSKSIATYKITRESYGNGIRLESNYSIAYNTNSTTFPITTQVPLFATASSSNDGFPNGFEVMIVGPNSGRSVYTRLTVFGNSFNSLLSQALSVVTYARDL